MSQSVAVFRHLDSETRTRQLDGKTTCHEMKGLLVESSGARKMSVSFSALSTSCRTQCSHLRCPTPRFRRSPSLEQRAGLVCSTKSRGSADRDLRRQSAQERRGDATRALTSSTCSSLVNTAELLVSYFFMMGHSLLRVHNCGP